MAKLRFSSTENAVERYFTKAFELWPRIDDLQILSARVDDTVNNMNADLIVISPFNPNDQSITQVGPFIVKFKWGLQIDIWGSAEEKLIYVRSEAPKNEYGFDFGALELRYRITALSKLRKSLYLATVDVWQEEIKKARSL